MNTRSPSTEIDRPSTSLAEAWILVAGIGGTALIMAVAILAAASSSELGTLECDGGGIVGAGGPGRCLALAVIHIEVNESGDPDQEPGFRRSPHSPRTARE